MDEDLSSLKRIQAFMELIHRAKHLGHAPSFVSTPTEHGDNINVILTINGERQHAGIVFWDVRLLQEQGLVDTLDEEEVALGLNITDGMVEDVDAILEYVKRRLGGLQGT